MRILISFFICLVILTGCNQSTTHNPTAKEILVQTPNADIFQLKGIVYINANNIEWVQTTELTTGKSVGTITKQYKNGHTFIRSINS